jgi:hypothetical protein
VWGAGHGERSPARTNQRNSVLQRTRELLIRQRTMLVNALRAHPAEFGIVASRGITRVPDLVAASEDAEAPIPEIAREALDLIVAWCRSNEAARTYPPRLSPKAKPRPHRAGPPQIRPSPAGQQRSAHGERRGGRERRTEGASG